MTVLLVLRHAATDWNEAGLIQGRADRPLSEAGRLCVSRWRLPPEAKEFRCVSSPLLRAMETARLLGLSPEPEPGLIEMDWGEWEGCSLAGLRRDLGAAMAENEAAGLHFRPPGGESPLDVQTRLAPFLRSLTGPTLAVTHKGVLRALYALASGWTMRDKPETRLKERCTHRFEIEPSGGISVRELNIPLEPGR
jgi:probable phosphoglycerate mutase